MGYRAMGIQYSNLGEVGRATEYFTKAFQLREHASELEKLEITAVYYRDVTGELDKATQTFEEEIQTYPREYAPYAHLGIILGDKDCMRKLWRSRGKACVLRRTTHFRT